MDLGVIVPTNFSIYKLCFDKLGVTIKINEKGKVKFKPVISLFIPGEIWVEKFIDYTFSSDECYVKLGTDEINFIKTINCNPGVNPFISNKDGVFRKIKGWEWDYFITNGSINLGEDETYDGKKTKNQELFELVQDFYEKNYHN